MLIDCIKGLDNVGFENQNDAPFLSKKPNSPARQMEVVVEKAVLEKGSLIVAHELWEHGSKSPREQFEDQLSELVYEADQMKLTKHLVRFDESYETFG